MNMPASLNQDPEPGPSAVNVSDSQMRLFVNSKKEKIKCIAHVSHILLMLKSSLLKGSLFPFFSSPFSMFTPGGTGYLQKWFHTSCPFSHSKSPRRTGTTRVTTWTWLPGTHPTRRTRVTHPMHQHETTLRIAPGSRESHQPSHHRPLVLLGSHLLLDSEGQPVVFSSCLLLKTMDTYTKARIG